MVKQRVKQDENGVLYQGIELIRYNQALTSLSSKFSDYIDSVLTCLLKQVKVDDVGLLTDILTILATQGWEKYEDETFAYEAIDHLMTLFTTPLEKVQVVFTSVQQEWDGNVSYAKKYNSYKVVWWKLFNSPDASDWTNVLTLIELIFTIPFSNGRLERCFLQLRLVKTNRRCSLGEDHLDHLVRIRIEGPPLDKWDPTNAVRCWWTDKTRRVNHGDVRTPPSRKPKDVDKQEPYQLDLMDWETWLDSD